MTVDIEKLKALADAAIEQEKRWKDAGEPWSIWNKCLLELQAAANPAVVLELITNQKRMAARLLRCTSCAGQGEVYSGRTSYEGFHQPGEPIMGKCGECDGDGVLGDAGDCISILDEVETLRAELAGLKTGYEAYERVNAGLRAENEALRQILSGSHEFILNDARTRHMCDETGQVSPMFPKRVGILAAIDTALSKDASHD
ncbi:hypothetical protein V2K57_11820 [Pseudomonas alliivorans]|nr:hypothetical protein [Pseudomonas alliivorans]MEE4701404.1 hypothetical protein [Pseudomonas alliivorans]MEE4737062.1 hypothetical protein [Pseudomonas alliivorans]